MQEYAGDEVIVPGIFWLSNVHEIYSFVCIAESDILQGIGPGSEGIGRDYEWDDYERLVTIVKHDLDTSSTISTTPGCKRPRSACTRWSSRP